jgi:G3E family GTPase
VQQVAFADKILLNKIDLVSAADKTNVTKRIRVSASTICVFGGGVEARHGHSKKGKPTTIHEG